jgi:hypothetical protein
MKIRLPLSMIMLTFAGAPAFSNEAGQTTIEPMPAKLETRYALSALPPAMREHATVHLLDPSQGYHLSKKGTSGVECLVARTAWEQADFRNDIYVPVCYDAAGTKTYLKVIMDAAALRARGMSATALKAEIAKRYKSKTYTVPERPGMSYMTEPMHRTWMLPDFKVHTMSGPHLMFYAPHLTDADIGAVAGDYSHPFVFEEGIAEQRYIIHLIGAAEKAKMLADEKPLLDELCAYRDVLCLEGKAR